MSLNGAIDWRFLTEDQKFALVNRMLFGRFSDQKPSGEEIWRKLEGQGYWVTEYYPIAGPVTLTLAKAVQGKIESVCAVCFPNRFDGLLRIALRAEGLMIEDGLDEVGHNSL